MKLRMIELLFEPRDLWVGVYWTRRAQGFDGPGELHIYACALPCLPLHIVLTEDR